MYVQLALDPLYFQFYSPNHSLYPDQAAYYDPNADPKTRPTFAGVLSGYDFTDAAHPFWEVYIRRHTKDYNCVHLNPCFKRKDGSNNQPFAGITSQAYSITVTDEAKDHGKDPADTDKCAAFSDLISTTDHLRAYAEACGLNTNAESLIIDVKVMNMEDGWTEVDFKNVFNNLKSITFLCSEGEEDAVFDNAMEALIDFEGSLTIQKRDGGRRLEDVLPTVEKERVFKGKLTKVTIGEGLFNTNQYVVIVSSSCWSVA